MGKNREKIGPPAKFVTEAPSDKIKTLVKKKVKQFIKGFDPPLDEHDKAID